MNRSYRSSMEFSLKWKSLQANHTDIYFAEKIDFWRDLFPGEMRDHLSALEVGEVCRENFSPGEIVPRFDEKKIVKFSKKHFAPEKTSGSLTALAGRFYPVSFARRALNRFRGDMTTFRVIDVDDDYLSADTNHPLSQYEIDICGRCISKLRAVEERGGASNHIAELITLDGPGMQAPYPDLKTDFYREYPFGRENSDDDSIFYSKPRMVNHLDNTAISRIRSIYERLLPENAKILDLMSSWTSHLPENKNFMATGLGLNEKELKANTALSETIIQDLNRSAELTLKNGEFDAVICTASIEYLVRPVEIFKEIARVLRPGAPFIVSFSDRWFPGKEITLWSDLHPFERVGLVLDYFLKSGSYEDLHTESVRGLPRPEDDKYYNQNFISDPVFAVWGHAKKADN